MRLVQERRRGKEGTGRNPHLPVNMPVGANADAPATRAAKVTRVRRMIDDRVPYPQEA